MLKKRTRYTAQLTLQLALEAAKGLKAMNELASEYGMHPTQIREWKRQRLDAGDTLFNRHGARQHREQREREVERYEHMRRIDEPYTKTPFDGWPRMTAHVRRLGLPVNHQRVQRVMQTMGL